MPTDRDAALMRHLAERVMGWKLIAPNALSWDCGDGLPYRFDIDLDSWADAGMVWEKAREKGIILSLSGIGDRWRVSQTKTYVDEWMLDSKTGSGPRAICEAVAKATGWEG